MFGVHLRDHADRALDALRLALRQASAKCAILAEVNRAQLKRSCTAPRTRRNRCKPPSPSRRWPNLWRWESRCRRARCRCSPRCNRPLQ